MNDFDVVYDLLANGGKGKVTILNVTPRADAWASRHKAKLDALMNGLFAELGHRQLSRPFVEEVQRRFAALVAGTGWSPVSVGLAPGYVEAPGPAKVAAFARAGLSDLMRNPRSVS